MRPYPTSRARPPPDRAQELRSDRPERRRHRTIGQSKDHKVFSSVREKDGEWVKMMTIRYRRKK